MGIRRSPLESFHRRPLMRTFDIFIVISFDQGVENSGVVVNLRRINAHVTSL